MKCVVVFLIAHAIICSGTVHPAYNPVFEYDVPVASQPLVYASPSVHPGPYVGSYGSYAVHTTPAVSHSFSQTQTHPVSYVKPVTVFGGSNSYYAPGYGSAYGQSVSGHYYQPAAATSSVQSTRLIVPQTSRIFRYQSNQQYNNAPQSGESQFNNQDSNRNVKNQRRPQNYNNNNQGFNRNNQQYSQNGPAQYQNQYNRNGQNQFEQNDQSQYNRRVYADSMPYTNGGEQVKLRRYQVHRPGLKKEFYDVEERTIIRPAGSAVVEFDPPSKKQDITDYQPFGSNSNFNQGQWNSQKGGQGQGTKGRNNGPNSFNQNGFRPNQGGQSGQGGQGGFSQGGQGGQGGFNQGGQGGFNQGGQGGFSQGGQSGQGGFSNQGGFNSQGGGSNDGPLFIPDDQDVGFQVPDCGYGQQTPVYEYGPPVTSFENQQPPQYHPTTFSPPTNNYPTTTSQYPTTTAGYPTTANIPNQTYLPPNYGSTDQSFQSTSNGGDFGSSTTPGVFIPSSTAGSSSTGSPTTTPQQSEIYISSTTPVTVTIVDKNENNTQSRKTPFQTPGIIYAGQGGQGQGGQGQGGQGQGNQGAAQNGQRSQGGQGFYYSQPVQNGQSDENQADQFQNELPPRGDLSQYRSAEQPDQFYHELPRSRYTNQPNRPPQAYNVYSRSRGEPTEAPYGRIEDAEIVEIDRMRNGTNARNRTGQGNNQQTARLIQLYTGNGGVTEVGQTDDQTNSRYSPDQNQNQNQNQNAQYQDAGNVRGRIISVTPPPATAIPTETVNRRRIVVSKPVTTVEEIVEPDNSTSADGQSGNKNQRGNYRSNYADGNRRDQQQQQRNYNSNGDRDQSNRNFNNNGDRDQNNRNFNNNGDSRANSRYQNSFESDEFNDNGESAKYRNDNNFSGYDDNSSEFNGNFRSAEYNNNADNYRSGEYYGDSRENFDDGNYDGNVNSQSQSRKANVEDDSKSSTPTGVFISTTPSTASQRIIYVQPVSQDFASQKAVPPKKQ